MLDHINGEKIGSITEPYLIAPLNKYRKQPVFNEALNAAKTAFARAGAILPISIPDRCILIQEYPASRLAIFIFERIIAGREHQVTLTVNLDAEGKPVQKAGIRFN